jgi:phenylalanyl-tRNA synthetase beta chain
MLQTLARNSRAVSGSLALFEVARIYSPRGDDLPQEIETVCAAFYGGRLGWWRDPEHEPSDLYDAKARLDTLLTALHVRAEYRETVDYSYLPGRTAEVYVHGSRIGIIGEVHPRVVAAFDLKTDTTATMFELDLDALLPHVPEIVHFEPVSPYPTAEQDLAVIVDRDVPAAAITRLIESSKLVRAVSVLSLYDGPPIPRGKKSLACHISYQSPERTLSDEDVAKERTRIVERLKRELNAEPRT